jgi:hypothetical protein
MSIGPAVATAADSDQATRVLRPRESGIYYRRPVAHRVHVVEQSKSKEITARPFANNAPIFRIDIERTAFVKRGTTIDFVDGAPNSVTVVKDSEALAIAQLPIAIMNAVITGATDAVTQQSKLQTARADLFTARKKRLDAETEWINAITAQGKATNSVGTNRAGDILSPPAIRSGAPPAATVLTPEQCRNLRIEDPEICSN